MDWSAPEAGFLGLAGSDGRDRAADPDQEHQGAAGATPFERLPPGVALKSPKQPLRVVTM
jgi:hypothetical protein